MWWRSYTIHMLPSPAQRWPGRVNIKTCLSQISGLKYIIEFLCFNNHGRITIGNFLFTVVGGDILLFQFNFHVVHRGMRFCHGDPWWQDIVPSLSVMTAELKLKIVFNCLGKASMERAISSVTFNHSVISFCCCYYPDISAYHIHPSSKLCLMFKHCGN